jgi:hypothetical protein
MMIWIRVEDQLPPMNEHVLVYFGGGYRPVREGYLSRAPYKDEPQYGWNRPLFVDATQHYGDEGWPDELQATHWMPMPDAPHAARSPTTKE